jgi:hypothetical protein
MELQLYSTLYVSDGLFIHHQESRTVHTASDICQTDSADCLLEGTRWNGRCSSTLHVSDGLFIHHQESRTVHTASGICQILLTAC